MKLIAITGGIGSGKSMVARIVSTMGYPVCDTDSLARSLMASDPTLKQQLSSAFGPNTYLSDGNVNRPYLAQVAFASDKARQRLNSIVHPAVANYVVQWAHKDTTPMAFVETALLNTSGMRPMVDTVWHVTAPVAQRIERVTARSGLTPDEVLRRIHSQAHDDEPRTGDVVLLNDGQQALLPQIVDALNDLNFRD